MTGMAMPPPMTGMRTAMGTAAGGGGGFGSGAIREGKYTEQIYGMIRDHKYSQAVDVLNTKLLEFPNSRSAASMLAYCFYHMGDFQNALQMYDRLMRMCAAACTAQPRAAAPLAAVMWPRHTSLRLNLRLWGPAASLPTRHTRDNRNSGVLPTQTPMSYP